MASLVSPKPVSYMQHTLQYNPYQQRGVGAPYSDTPSNAAVGAGIPQAASLAATLQQHATPNQALTVNVNGFATGAAAAAAAPIGTVPMHEEQKIYSLVIDLLNPNTREGALLELSKKREQYDDLALVLWHSFGTWRPGGPTFIFSHAARRYHAGAAARNRFRLLLPLPAKPHRSPVQPRLQCTRPASMRRFPPRDEAAFLKR